MRLLRQTIYLSVAAMILANCAASTSSPPTTSAEAPTAAPLATAGGVSVPLGASAAPALAPGSPSVVATVIAPTPEPLADGIVNLAHLNFLSEEVDIGGTPMILAHIYSEAPRYEWVDAAGEGIAAVDDVARAAIVYLDFYAATGNQRALERARGCLNFVRYVQADDGQFYNFVRDRGGTINRDGPTSYKSMGWWAFRGMWALARGYALFKDHDPAYAGQLRESYLRAERALESSITAHGRSPRCMASMPRPGCRAARPTRPASRCWRWLSIRRRRQMMTPPRCS